MLMGFEEFYGKIPIDFIVPVPLHKKRLQEREFNQAKLICEELSRAKKIAICEEAVLRIRKTPPQTQLNRAQRRHNIKGAFKYNDEMTISNATILVVDDVMTTGATVNEVCAMLKKGKPNALYVLTLARAFNSVK